MTSFFLVSLLLTLKIFYTLFTPKFLLLTFKHVHAGWDIGPYFLRQLTILPYINQHINSQNYIILNFNNNLPEMLHGHLFARF